MPVRPLNPLFAALLAHHFSPFFLVSRFSHTGGGSISCTVASFSSHTATSSRILASPEAILRPRLGLTPSFVATWLGVQPMLSQHSRKRAGVMLLMACGQFLWVFHNNNRIEYYSHLLPHRSRKTNCCSLFSKLNTAGSAKPRCNRHSSSSLTTFHTAILYM